MPASVDSSELDGLRERAYGPHADILSDPIALARLHELEDLVRAESAGRAATEAAESPARAAAEAAARVAADIATRPAALSGNSTTESGDRVETRVDTPTHRPTTEVSTTPPAGNPRRSSMRVRVGVALGVAAVVAAVGVVTFVAASGGSSDPVADPGSTPSAAIPVLKDQRITTSSASWYDLFLDHLRDDVLSGPGMSELAPRLIRDELRPNGSLYGRTVWTGSTTDAQYCMIITDSPLPAITCIWIDDAYSSASSITLPSGSTTSAFDVSVIPGTPVIYTLLPGGQVTATPVE